MSKVLNVKRSNDLKNDNMTIRGTDYNKQTSYDKQTSNDKLKSRIEVTKLRL